MSSYESNMGKGEKQSTKMRTGNIRGKVVQHASGGGRTGILARHDWGRSRYGSACRWDPTRKSQRKQKTVSSRGRKPKKDQEVILDKHSDQTSPRNLHDIRG